jgi:predicted ATPase
MGCRTSAYNGEQLVVAFWVSVWPDKTRHEHGKLDEPSAAALEKAMIESIEFTNFKALRQTTLPLSPFTLLLGPNGSGKTSVLQALQNIAALIIRGAFGSTTTVAHYDMPIWSKVRSITATEQEVEVTVKLRVRWERRSVVAVFEWNAGRGHITAQFNQPDGTILELAAAEPIVRWLARIQTYALNPAATAGAAAVSAAPLGWDGSGLVAVLDDLKDNYPDRWESLLAELRRWLPEYDTIAFDKPQPGQKSIIMETKRGRYRIPAAELSQGTLIALALLTLAYSPNPPSLIGLEEIDRGLHPRLLRHLQDALYRLSYPESCGEKRPPIQVVATTHSPYLLDLYREHPEEVVLAQKEGLEVQFRRLTDIEHYEEILGEAPLSEVWYSGVLGGVSVKP